jgi:hypothetical protein
MVGVRLEAFGVSLCVRCSVVLGCNGLKRLLLRDDDCGSCCNLQTSLFGQALGWLWLVCISILACHFRLIWEGPNIPSRARSQNCSTVGESDR